MSEDQTVKEWKTTIRLQFPAESRGWNAEQYQEWLTAQYKEQLEKIGVPQKAIESTYPYFVTSLCDAMEFELYPENTYHSLETPVSIKYSPEKASEEYDPYWNLGETETKTLQ